MAVRKYSSIPIYSLRLVKEKSVKFPLLQIDNHQQAAEIFYAYLKDRPTENLVILLLDGAMNFLGLVPIAIGSISGVKVRERDVLTPALLHRANSFIVGHNHPSGDPTPSEQDLRFTEELRKVSEMMGCPMMDHVIVSSGISKMTYSFHAHGLITQDGQQPI